MDISGSGPELVLRQRIAELELALANQKSSSNKELVDLEERNAKLRASFEKNELLRRKLEYELASTRKDFNCEIRSMKQEQEVSKKEIQACKEEVSVRTKDLKSMEMVLRDQGILFDTEKTDMKNQIKSHEEENIKQTNEINNLREKINELNGKCSAVTSQLSSKSMEIDNTEKLLNNQNKFLEKEKVELTNEIGKLKSINADLRIENEKVTIEARTRFDEVTSKYKKLEDEHSKKLFKQKTLENVLNDKQMEFHKEKEMFTKENAKLKEINDKMTLDWKSKNDELNEKCSLLESQRIEHTSTIFKLVEDNKSICNNENEWMEKNKDLQSRIKELSENIEAERASHLQTKFNAEVLELKLKDSGKELSKCMNTLEEAGKRLQTFESDISNDQIIYKQTKEKLDERIIDLEDKYELQSKGIIDKSVALSNLNLEADKLKKELSDTRVELAEIRSHEREIIKEMKVLLINFVGDYDKNLPDEWTLDSVLEVMKPTLKDTNDKIKETQHNLDIAQSSLEKLNSELEGQKNDFVNRDKALEEAEKLVQNAQMQCSKSDIKCGEYEQQLKLLHKNMKNLNSELVQKQKEINIVRSDLNKADYETKQHVESTVSSLQIMSDLLMTGAVQPAYPNNHSINELKDLIVDKLKQNICRETAKDEKLGKLDVENKDLTTKLRHHKLANKKLRKVNAALLAQTERHLLDAKNEKQILEEHLNEYNIALKGIEKNRDEAITKCTLVEKSLKETELVNDKLNRTLQQYEYENKYLVSAIAIITGGLWGLILRHQSLCLEKNILVNTVRQLSKLKNDMSELVEIVHLDPCNEAPQGFKSRHKVKGIFRFRIAVITILAANRFSKIATNTKTINSMKKSISSCNHILFYTTSGNTDTLTSPSITENENKGSKLTSWLRNDVFKHASLDAISPLLKLQKFSESSCSTLVETICTCYVRYLDSVRVEMDRSTSFSYGEEQFSLCYHLMTGLKSLLNTDNSTVYLSSAKVTSDLRETLIELTNMNHTSEKEKVTLVSNCERYKEERNQLKSQITFHIGQLEETEKTLKSHVAELEKQVEKAISEDQFNGVCVNLDDALKREQQLQLLLNDQNEEIIQINSKIEKQEECYQQSIDTFADSLKVHQKDFKNLQGKASALKTKLSKLEGEKEDLAIMLEQEHGQLEQFSLERELLMQYIANISSVIENTRGNSDISLLREFNKLHEAKLPEILLQADGKIISPEMQVCQNTVISLIDLHKGTIQRVLNLLQEKQYLCNKISSLENDAKTHKSNVHKLKSQISALCEEEMDNSKQSTSTGAKETSSPIFIPLQGNYNAHF